MIILTVAVLIYGIRNRKDLVIRTENRKGYFWFLLLFIPVSVLGIFSAAKVFDPHLSFLIVLFDCLLIGVAEEGMYRGILMGALLKKTKPVIAILISSVMFSLLHLLNLLGGLDSSEVVNQMIFTFIMGLFLGSVYFYTKNILFPILFHSIWDYIILSNALVDSPIFLAAVFGVAGLEAAISIILLLKFIKMPKPM